jgi:hypothetical protein
MHLFSVGSAAATAVTLPRSGAEILLVSYQENKTQLAASSFGLPLVLESFEREDKVHVDVYGIFDYPFGSVANVLKVPATWCDIVALHPNVKACTSRKLPGTQQLIFYAGRQGYEPPEDAHPFIYGPAGGNFSAVQRTKEAPLRCREGFFRTVYVKIFRLRESFDLE